MRKIYKSLLCSILICAISFVSYAADLNELQDQKNNIQSQLDESNNQLNDVNNELTDNLQQIQKLDENPGVKVTQGQKDKIGENIYYSVYTSQIMEDLQANKVMKLKEGDIVSVTVKNTNKTISQLLRNFFYRVSGNDTYQISAQHGGIVMVNAN